MAMSCTQSGPPSEPLSLFPFPGSCLLAMSSTMHLKSKLWCPRRPSLLWGRPASPLLHPGLPRGAHSHLARWRLVDALAHCPPLPLGSLASGPLPGLPPRLRGRCALHTLPHSVSGGSPPPRASRVPAVGAGRARRGARPADASAHARDVISVKYICKTHLLIFCICLSTVEICISNCFTLRLTNQHEETTRQKYRKRSARAGRPGPAEGARGAHGSQPTATLTRQAGIVTPSCG